MQEKLDGYYDTKYWMADGNPILIEQFGRMAMIEFYAMVNKRLAETKRMAKSKPNG